MTSVICIFLMDIVKVFSENVKKYRNNLGITQDELAFRSGLHRTYISAVECKRRSISLENIERIANALEIKSYKLLKEDDENKQK